MSAVPPPVRIIRFMLFLQKLFVTAEYFHSYRDSTLHLILLWEKVKKGNRKETGENSAETQRGQEFEKG